MIGYSEFRTNLPGGLTENRYMTRAYIVEQDGTGRHSVAEELIKPYTWTQFAGWSPDGKQAILGRGWESPENARWEEEHKKFGLMTFFAPKKLQVDTKTLQVIIEGRLTSTFGKKGIEEENVKYLMSFDFVGGFLKIKEFSRLLPKEQGDTK
mgnify:CR=1 FL=1